jgi:hypothetical protein
MNARTLTRQASVLIDALDLVEQPQIQVTLNGILIGHSPLNSVSLPLPPKQSK